MEKKYPAGVEFTRCYKIPAMKRKEEKKPPPIIRQERLGLGGSP